jgi:hypothetical protein
MSVKIRILDQILLMHRIVMLQTKMISRSNPRNTAMSLLSLLFLLLSYAITVSEAYIPTCRSSSVPYCRRCWKLSSSVVEDDKISDSWKLAPDSRRNFLVGYSGFLTGIIGCTTSSFSKVRYQY